jgi:hypothetical protein
MNFNFSHAVYFGNSFHMKDRGSRLLGAMNESGLSISSHIYYQKYNLADTIHGLTQPGVLGYLSCPDLDENCCRSF